MLVGLSLASRKSFIYANTKRKARDDRIDNSLEYLKCIFDS